MRKRLVEGSLKSELNTFKGHILIVIHTRLSWTNNALEYRITMDTYREDGLECYHLVLGLVVDMRDY